MTSALHQITMSFSAEEDRMLLRVGTTDKAEYKLWMTRRFIRVLWSALIQVLENKSDLKADIRPTAKKAVMAMEHKEALGSTDFSRGHEEDYQDMTKKTGPLLIVGGTVKQGKGGVTQLNLQVQGGGKVKLALNQKLLHGLCKLLIETTAKAGWDLDLAVGDAAGFVVPEDRTQVH